MAMYGPVRMIAAAPATANPYPRSSMVAAKSAVTTAITSRIFAMNGSQCAFPGIFWNSPVATIIAAPTIRTRNAAGQCSGSAYASQMPKARMMIAIVQKRVGVDLGEAR